MKKEKIPEAEMSEKSYIVYIWEDYEKEMEKTKPGVSRTKEFCYPPVLPIIFYDGPDNWTAATSLHERVMFSDIFGRYISDYHCILFAKTDFADHRSIFVEAECAAERSGCIQGPDKGAEDGRTV